MILNGIEYPNQIIEAIKTNTLVVFAGAGVSMGSPTNLPNYKDLCAQIAEDTANEKDENETCEVFLGTLRAKGIDVNQCAADILSNTCITHNDEHEAIIKLFLDPKGIRIVTTNYDQMFEQVVEGLDIQIHNAPALPLGNDVSGIVHLHGNVDCPKYMTVTDEDFGKAYLTDGYASKFLTRLFDSYTVLFIGYSYDDTIIKYLTRAMSREHKQKRYILTDASEKRWSDLGIQPILFPKNAFAKMTKSLEKLGERVKRGLVEWRAYLAEIKGAPPQDQTIDSEIEYCLESIERAQVLANCVDGSESWCKFLDSHKAFENIFSNNRLDEKDRIWARWLCNKVIGIKDEVFVRILVGHAQTISEEFAEMMLRRISEASFPAEEMGKFITLCEKHIRTQYQIFQLIEKCYNCNLLHLCEFLYKKLWDVELRYERRNWLYESLEYKLVFMGEAWNTNNCWEKCQWKNSKDFAKNLLLFFKSKIEEIYDKYEIVTDDAHTDLIEPWDLSMRVIEVREPKYHEDMIDCLVKQITQLSKTMQTVDEGFLRVYIHDGLASKSLLCKKIFLRILRESAAFSADECYELFERGDFFAFREGKEQVFLLINKIFNHLSTKNKDKLIDHIENIDSERDYGEYEKYNWCVWIKKVCPDNVRINSIEKEILSRNDFKPRPHPERDFDISSSTRGPDKSPKSVEELKTLGCGEAFQYVLEYKENHWEDVNRRGLLSVFSKIISEDYSWALQVIDLLNQHEADSELLYGCFQGFQSEEFSIEKETDLIEKLICGKKTFEYSLDIARMIHKTVQREQFGEYYSVCGNRLFDLGYKVIMSRNEEEKRLERVIDYTLNSTIGLGLLSIIRILAYEPGKRLGKKYKALFEKFLSASGWEQRVVTCAVVGHYNLFYFRDKTWTTKTLEPILKGREEQGFASAWEGYVWFSQSLNRDVADALSKVFFEAMTHISWLSGEVRKRFSELYLTLLIYVIPNPIAQYIPRFYQYASIEDRANFLKDIENRLWNMEDEAQKQWWNSWLKRFVVNFIEKNKPTPPNEKEIGILLDCATKMKTLFPEVVDIVTKGHMTGINNDLLWYELLENKHQETYPESTAKLLTSVLNASEFFIQPDTCLRKIAKELKGLTAETKRELDEALLRHNIQL